ncbi:MAG: PilZ domain-containing protein [Bacteriovoracaceae bacterium]|jgi:c-di-GMP-binding flagellar brake protein YcgR|nr:PilZ domain-containing protein [Bacteriovoracaceae bacterium]
MSDKNKKHYFDKVKKSDFEVIFMTLLSEPEPHVVIWQKGHEEVIEEFVPTTFNKDENALYVRKKGSFLDRIVGSDFVDNEVLVKFEVDRYKYFLTAKLYFSPSVKEFKISIAGEFYKSQQRANYRLTADEDNSIQIKINNYLHNCIDISAGGTSMSISTKEKEIYIKGKIYNNCELTYNKVKYAIPAIKIMGIFSDTDESGADSGLLRLGLAFINLSKANEEALFKQINTQIRYYEIKKKFDLGPE